MTIHNPQHMHRKLMCVCGSRIYTLLKAFIQLDGHGFTDFQLTDFPKTATFKVRMLIFCFTAQAPVRALIRCALENNDACAFTANSR